MTIEIKRHTILLEVQRKFHEAYPFLKLEFADKPHQAGEATRNGNWYSAGTRLLDIATKPEPGKIIVRPWDKTGEIEKEFQDTFGLYPQIFRLDEGRWIETAGTDLFTLEEQNEIGRNMLEKSHAVSPNHRQHLL